MNWKKHWLLYMIFFIRTMGKLYRLKVDEDLAEKLEEKYDFSEEEIDDLPMYYWYDVNLIQLIKDEPQQF